MRSIRSFSRARRSESQRGYALIAAIVLAVLYLSLVELMMIDSSRELAEARRFRARIIANTLAENGAELAAVEIANPERVSSSARASDSQGEFSGHMNKDGGGNFDIEAEGKAAGLIASEAKVLVRGRVLNGQVKIQYTIHTP